MGKKSILVVDDEPNSLFVTSQILKDQSYQVITAENGNVALKKIRSENINAVITDERMPGMSGMELLPPEPLPGLNRTPIVCPENA